MPAIFRLLPFADRIRAWMENGDHVEVEEECSSWAQELVSEYGEAEIVGLLLEDIQAVFSCIGAREAADLRTQVDRPDIATTSYRIQAILTALIFEQPRLGRDYLAGRERASARIAAAVEQRRRYGEGI